jgi:glycosyltransferase involved in cell wall biosynthesis
MTGVSKQGMRKKLAILATHPIQYLAPLWRALARDPQIDLHVYFGSDFSVRGYLDSGFGVRLAWDVPLTDGYAHTFLSTDSATEDSGKVRLGTWDFLRKIGRFRPDAFLFTGYSPFGFYLKGFAAVRSLGIPILMRADATDEALQRSAAKSFARQVLLRLLYCHMATCIAVGLNSQRHYLSKGVPESRIALSPLCVDTNLMAQQVQRWLPERQATRKQLGFREDQVIFIFSGKLTPKKDPARIAAAFREMEESRRRQTGLIVMGDGLLRGELENQLRSIAGLTSVFAGFQNQSQIGRFLSAADCLILPSSGETWGLVVNEALQFGLPAIVSDHVGCRHDLIEGGATGFVFPYGEAAALEDRMCRMMHLIETSEQAVREACRQKIQAYSVEAAVAGIREAVLRG